MPSLPNHTDYDTIIVGAGPAGGTLARELSSAGKKVLLTERFSDFSINSFSSGAAPFSIMDEFQFPKSLISTYWSKFRLSSPKDSHLWENEAPFGVIFDFQKLKEYLSDQTRSYGGDVKLGLIYQKHETEKGICHVWFKDKQSGEIKRYRSSVLVDATGSERHVLAKKKKKVPSIVATGIEVHVKVESVLTASFQKTLSFYLGRNWIPHGYAWVFPIDDTRLKVGVIRYLEESSSLNACLENFLSLSLNNAPYEVIEKHGKTLVYHLGQKDRLDDGENVIAIGDAISFLNPLGCEGIRHALHSGRIASKHVRSYLEGISSSWRGYARDLKSYTGYKWFLSEWVARKVYFKLSDQDLDRCLKAAKTFSNRELYLAFFGYDWKMFIKTLYFFILQKAMFWGRFGL